jgi:phenylacetate-coenzyme A ligase PaaK-like adenylate-forming protein
MGAKSPRILATYALTEGRVAWGECSEEATGYHTYPDMEFFEIVDPKTGERVDEGETGEIVYTALDWRGSCVIRYRTGDIAKGGITYEKCPNCNRTVPRIDSDITRLSEHKDFNLSKVKGTLIDLNAFFPLLAGHPEVEEWQVEIKKKDDDPFEMDELYVYIAPKPGADFEKLKSEIKKLILAETEIAPTAIIETKLHDLLAKLGMETELKEKRIVDRRP